jgi:uncharacterized protein YbaA (DUF1428 family)
MAKTKGKYVDGFVLIVPKKQIANYKKMARMGAKMWKKHGALEYKECMIEDAKVKAHEGTKPLSFPQLAKAKAGETIWFSYIVYKSRKHRDQVNAKVMKDSMMNQEEWKDMPMPFDMKRMAYGGFTVEVDA